MNRLLLTLAISAVSLTALAGCAGSDSDADTLEVVPDEVNQQQLERIEELANETSVREFQFDGQAALEPKILDLGGTLAAGAAVTSPELPDDEGVIDYNRRIISNDLSGETPAGQPVELRIKLKWYGNPGSSTDMDIYTNVPGEVGSFHPGRYDESMNWNIVTKTKVVNTVMVPDQPFEVGVQVSNSKDPHPDGIDYELTVGMHYAENVLTPGVPYALSIPEGARGIVLESAPVIGDEHIDSEFLLIGPNDELIKHGTWNDIATEQLFMGVRGAGEYVLFFPKMHGGFLRASTDVSNPDPVARPLAMITTETLIFQNGAPVPGTYEEQGEATGEAVPNNFGEEGTIEVNAVTSGNFPLDVYGFVRPTGGSADAAINISSTEGWVHTAYAFGTLYEDDSGRIGMTKGADGNRANLASGLTYGLVVNGGQVDVGYGIVSYER